MEDDEPIRELIHELIAAEGFTVRQARHGRQALELLEGMERPALILLDLTMPVMDGWQLLQELRRHDAWSQIPVIVVSAIELPVVPGAQEVVRKPFSRRTLVSAVLRNLPSHPLDERREAMAAPV